MAKIAPFRAVRPTRDKVHLVASRAVYTYSSRLLEAKLDSNPYSFLHIIDPEHKKENKSLPNSRERFLKVRASYDKAIENGIFIQEENPCYYLYQQIKNDRVYTGIIAGISIDDYFNGIIKKHEQTITQREEVFTDYLDVCEFNAEPVLLTYPDNDQVSQVLNKYLAIRSEYDFTNTDHVRHQLWPIDASEDIEVITQAFASFDSIYIADGHHRSASSAILGQRRNATQPEGLHSFFMAFLIPESQLDIYDFNRVVQGLNNYTEDTLIVKLADSFDITKLGTESYQPQELHEFSMYLNKNWYRLKAKPHTYDNSAPSGSLDAQILLDQVLSSIFDIHDLKTDNRIDFVGGLKGMQGLVDAVDHDRFDVAFALYPVSIDQLKAIADANEIMPPKTTWIEPKLRSGLTIFQF